MAQQVEDDFLDEFEEDQEEILKHFSVILIQSLFRSYLATELYENKLKTRFVDQFKLPTSQPLNIVKKARGPPRRPPKNGKPPQVKTIEEPTIREPIPTAIEFTIEPSTQDIPKESVTTENATKSPEKPQTLGVPNAKLRPMSMPVGFDPAMARQGLKTNVKVSPSKPETASNPTPFPVVQLKPVVPTGKSPTVTEIKAPPPPIVQIAPIAPNPTGPRGYDKPVPALPPKARITSLPPPGAKSNFPPKIPLPPPPSSKHEDRMQKPVQIFPGEVAQNSQISSDEATQNFTLIEDTGSVDDLPVPEETGKKKRCSIM
eukprot:TRINITY_DN1307_c0_g1_i3.p1 TRINITY_DN1307_c0_g1~~TRINITY_DN1307_c0_g1_i3.p1  ORF type:complete len:316 (-),score=69.54 TRINITY_DN1307_c0_g1_i3:31-978(-)